MIIYPIWEDDMLPGKVCLLLTLTLFVGIRHYFCCNLMTQWITFTQIPLIQEVIHSQPVYIMEL